jgi:hypothetical protein
LPDGDSSPRKIRQNFPGASVMSIGLEAQIGPLSFDRLPELWLDSRRHEPLTMAGVSFPDPDGSLYPLLAKGQTVTISFGYLDGQEGDWSVFSGTLESKTRTADSVKVMISGRDRKLLDKPITQSFRNETMENILSWCVGQAGLAPAHIDPTNLLMPRFMVSGQNVYEISQMLKAAAKRAFKQDLNAWALWLGRDGVNFGDFDEPGEAPVIASGELLISHSPKTGELSQVSSFLIPDMRHSRQFLLVDGPGGIYARHRAQMVRHEINQGSARTYIYYGPEQGHA